MFSIFYVKNAFSTFYSYHLSFYIYAGNLKMQIISHCLTSPTAITRSAATELRFHRLLSRSHHPTKITIITVQELFNLR